MFDTLKYSKILEAVGIPRVHAEAHVKVYAEIVEDELATKQDILTLKRDLVDMEHRLIIKMGAISAITMGLGIAVLTLVLR